MIDIILAVPAVFWLIWVCIVIFAIPAIKTLGAIFKWGVIGFFIFNVFYVMNNPVAAPMRDESRKAPVEFYEEPTDAEIVDRSLKPKMTEEEREERNKELFDAVEQAKQ